MWPNPQLTADLVTFTEDIRNEKLFFFFAVLVVFGTGLHKATYMRNYIEIEAGNFLCKISGIKLLYNDEYL